MAIGLDNGWHYPCGWRSSGTIVKSSEFYDTTSGTWTVSEDLPDNLYGSGSIRVGEKLYLIGEKTVRDTQTNFSQLIYHTGCKSLLQGRKCHG